MRANQREGERERRAGTNGQRREKMMGKRKESRREGERERGREREGEPYMKWGSILHKCIPSVCHTGREPEIHSKHLTNTPKFPPVFVFQQ